MVVELGVLRLVEAPDIGATAIRTDWQTWATWEWTPPDTADWSARMTFTAVTDPGTVGQVRFRVASTGTATLPVVVSGIAPNVLAPWLNLGAGKQRIILEVQKTVGVGGVRILQASGTVALSTLVDVPTVTPGTALALTGPAVATAAGSFAPVGTVLTTESGAVITTESGAPLVVEP